MLDWIRNESPGDPTNPRHWTAQRDGMTYRISEIITHPYQTRTLIKMMYRLHVLSFNAHISADTYSTLAACKGQATRIAKRAARMQDRGSD
jgi:hypothetical protein